MFRGQCLACHTVDGYRSMHGFLHHRDHASIRNILNMLHEYPEDSPYRTFMPPLVGSDGEIEALAAYLNDLVQSRSKSSGQEGVAKANVSVGSTEPSRTSGSPR
jgi:mono/diheme cytochrome c family protein